MRRFPILLAPLALMLAFNLVACGNKGPLVRPSDIEDVEDVSDDEPELEEEQAADPEDEALDESDGQAEDTSDDPVEVPPLADPGNG